MLSFEVGVLVALTCAAFARDGYCGVETVECAAVLQVCDILSWVQQSDVSSPETQSFNRLR